MNYEVDYEILIPTLGMVKVEADHESDAYDKAEKEIMILYPEVDEMDIDIVEVREAL